MGQQATAVTHFRYMGGVGCGGWNRLKVAFQPLKVISLTASWWYMQVYAGVGVASYCGPIFGLNNLH